MECLSLSGMSSCHHSSDIHLIQPFAQWNLGRFLSVFSKCPGYFPLLSVALSVSYYDVRSEEALDSVPAAF